MNPDISLIRNTLWVLDRIGAAGLPEDSLMIEIEIAAGRPLTTAQARDGIIFCKDNGWLASRRFTHLEPPAKKKGGMLVGGGML